MKLIICAALLVLPLSAIGAQTRAGDSTAAAPFAARDSAGTLRPGDIVRLRIWREPDLSGDFPVDEFGVVVFPKIGPIRVSLENSETLKDTLIKSYQVYLRNPSIDVMLLRRVNVLGAVRNPGLYPVDPTMTIADVIAAAGGATPIGKPGEVRLQRAGQTITGNLTGNTRVGELQLRSGDQLFVPERSWFSRNTAVVAAALSATVSLVIALSR